MAVGVEGAGERGGGEGGQRQHGGGGRGGINPGILWLFGRSRRRSGEVHLTCRWAGERPPAPSSRKVGHRGLGHPPVPFLTQQYCHLAKAHTT